MEKVIHCNSEEMKLKELILNETPLYFYRSTPFTDHGEFNYNGELTSSFFFEHLFSNAGKCSAYFNEISRYLNNRRFKSIVLIGNQGCGKTTFVHSLERAVNTDKKHFKFVFFDFDKNTSNPTISEYIELMSSYLLHLMQTDKQTNIVFLDLYERNHKLIKQKINANNNIEHFINSFKDIFILNKHDSGTEDDFIKDINRLYFNQILSIITLWHICQCKSNNTPKNELTPLVFCLDNLDVLVNQDIIELFFKEYFWFVRNIDSIIHSINDEYVRKQIGTFNNLFTFIFSCRQHTWARVKQVYVHQRAFIIVSNHLKDITDAFDKKEILNRREAYIQQNFEEAEDFCNTVTSIKQIISDMDTLEGQGHNIYDLFDDDYRQCNLTIESIIESNPDIVDEYKAVKDKSEGKCMNGARGIIYKELFDLFKGEGLFDQIGVLDFDSSQPLVSNARLILNYLNDKTYTKNRKNPRHIPFEKMVEDFKGMIDRDTLNNSIIAMFKLGYNSYWSELVAFNEINNNNLADCTSTEIFITQAGHEYLDLIATHFEFFNSRSTRRRTCTCALFSSSSIEQCENNNYEYNFQEIIQNVYDMVKNCCMKMSTFYNETMRIRFNSIQDYIESPFVYSNANVLHSERILHTHIRYIDQYRLFILNNKCNYDITTKKKINKILVNYIKEYINIGNLYPNITTHKSTDILFPAFLEKINIIEDSEYTDFNTKIDIK